jgi:hypothetical protein
MWGWKVIVLQITFISSTLRQDETTKQGPRILHKPNENTNLEFKGDFLVLVV